MKVDGSFCRRFRVGQQALCYDPRQSSHQAMWNDGLELPIMTSLMAASFPASAQLNRNRFVHGKERASLFAYSNSYFWRDRQQPAAAFCIQVQP